MTLPIDRTNKSALDANLVNGLTSDAPKLKANNQTLYDTIDELNGKVDTHANAATLAHPDASVTTAKIADAAVTTVKIADSAVTASKVVDGSLTAAKFVAGALTNDTQNALNIVAIQVDTTQRSINVKHPPSSLVAAVGDGVTNDTSAIRAICNYVMAQGGGTIYFPDGSYIVEFDVTDTMYYYLFKFAGNTRFIMSEGAKIKVSGLKPKLYSAVFGVDETKLPVSNISFLNVNIEGIGLLPAADTTTNQNPIGISFSVSSDLPIHSIQNVLIENCRLTNLDYGIYITHGSTTGSANRVTKNAQIKGCTAVGCVGSFCTVDGENIIVDGNTADGGNSSYAFDAVSVHAGVHVQIINNHFFNYGLGQVIHLRNSSENKCGTNDVLIANNIVRDCPTIAVQVAIGAGETVYGIDNVLVIGNKLENVYQGMVVTPGDASPGTPFKNIKIRGNHIYATEYGIQVNGNSGVPIERIEIEGNRVVCTGNDATSYGIFLQYLNYSHISDNDVESTANVAGHYTLNLKNLAYCHIKGFKAWAGNPSNGTPINIDTMTESSFLNAYFYGAYAFTNVTNCLIKANLFQSNGTIEGRTFGEGWEQSEANNVTFISGAAPTAESWIAGDKVINNVLAPGGYIGYVCTTSGTPGIWKGFGAIQA